MTQHAHESEDPPTPDAPGESPAPDADGTGKPVEELSAEEQLARFEEALKNDDWGHQPC